MMVNATSADTAAPASPASRPVTAASRLSAWCDNVIEMGWLAAVVVVPLFFNIYSSRVFEPDKLTTLRSIAIVMALAWLVKWFEERGNPNRDTRVDWRTPLVLPTLIMVIVYVISSALSVAPRTSLLGSYQRLQGTYTTFSYIVVFFMLLQGLRTRAQLERLLAIMVLNSFPIATYGLLQRMRIDPLPWGGDTVERVAGNMGNSIFIAAYLIMTFFINLYKVADAFVSIFRADKPRMADVTRAAAYIVIALMNAVVVTVLAGSRGPQLGWLAGLFFMALLMVQLIKRRKLRLGLTAGSILLGLAGLAFLIWINFDKVSPAANQLRDNVPLFRRLSSVMQTTEGTNVVRVLIWEGAAKLVAPHEPITKPDGAPDQWNALRPLIGYGPESMYVAYNRFYPPGLANIEARNASPDRSHNETWDSLVITGITGFLAYMFLFGSVLYFGFRWIGLIASRFESALFVTLWIVGGGSVGAYFVSIGSSNLLGVGVAGGIALGLAVFLIVSALINAFRKEGEDVHSALSLRDQMLLIAIVATVVAHFVEIHTGIAIASTRTHFWVLIAAMVVVGAGYLTTRSQATAAAAESSASIPAPAPAAASPAPGGTRRQRRAAQAASSQQQRRSGSRSGRSAFPDWFYAAASFGVLLGLVLGVMAFDFTNNIPRYTNAGQLFLRAMIELPPQPGFRDAATSSAGVLLMFLGTLILGMVLFTSELQVQGTLHDNTANVWPAAALIGAIGVFVWVAFGTFVAGRLVAFITSGQNSVDNILDIAEQLAAFPAYVYVLVAILMLVGAQVLRHEGVGAVSPPRGLNGIGGLITGLLSIPVALIAISYSNLQPIQADIVYKQASPWDQQGSRLLGGAGSPVQGWDMAIEHHRRAIQLAPNEDFYYLWLGRALLEKARSHPNPQQQQQALIRETDSFVKIIDDGTANWNRPAGRNALPSAGLSQQDLLNAAKIILEEARSINPLNTDHSANLARMWLQTVSVVQDPGEKERRYQNSIREYNAATNLSPNNAQLWNEWANLHIQRGEIDKAQEKLAQSLKIDKKFDSTRLLRASIFLTQAEPLNQRRLQAQQVIATTPATDTAKIKEANDTIAAVEPQWRALVLKAVPELEAALEINPKNVQTLSQMVVTQQQLGDVKAAIKYGEALAELNAQDWAVWRNLALLYNEAQDKPKAVDAAKKSLALAPPDQQAALQAFVVQLGGQ
jgi:tetratricopeptide (TPR) repeat protein/O-antigen ligase